MIRHILKSAPPHFCLAATVRGSFLRDLAPLCFDPAGRRLELALALPGGGAADVRLTQARPGGPVEVCAEAEARPAGPHSRTGRDPAGPPGTALPALQPMLRSMLRWDEDLSLFHALTDRDPGLSWARAAGAGRVLRSPTAFEDLVKGAIAGTGGAALAATLSARLCRLLGPAAPSGRRAFPGAAEMAAQPLSFYQRDLGAGRLAAPLRDLAEFCHVLLHAEALRRHPVPPPFPPGRLPPRRQVEEHFLQEREWSERVEALLGSLPGIGQRAAMLLLPLCGCHDWVSVTPSMRAAWRRRFPRAPRGERELHRQIGARIQRYGVYRGLALGLLLSAPVVAPALPA